MNEQTHHHVTREEDRVPLKPKLGFGFGGTNEVLMSCAIWSLAGIVFNITLGVSPALIGVAAAVPRLWESVTDPAIGSWSDNFRSRFGRRKPFIAVGTLIVALTFGGMWFVPRGWTAQAYFWFLLVASFTYFSGYALYNIPWSAMGYEMTSDYHERTKIMVYRTVFSSFGGLICPWMFALAKLKCFPDVIVGSRYVGIGGALLMLLLGLMTVLWGKENYSVQVERQEKVPIIEGLRLSLKNRPFVAIMGSVTLMTIGMTLVGSLGGYLLIYYTFKGDLGAAAIITGWCGTAYQTVSICATFVINYMSGKLGKKNTLQIFLGIALLGCFSKWWCFTPEHPYLALIPNILIDMGFAAVWTLNHAMIADVCDVDELKTGARREGYYGAVYNWFMKLGLSGSIFLSGFVLVWTGFDQKYGRHQSPRTLYLMLLWTVVISAVANAIAMMILSRYNITEDEAYRVRAELQERRRTDQAEEAAAAACVDAN